MNSSTILTLCFALLAIWLGISDAAAEPNRQLRRLLARCRRSSSLSRLHQQPRGDES